MFVNYILILVFSIAVGALATLGVRKLALRMKVLDYPTMKRKAHAAPVPLMGGVAISLSIICVGIVAWQLGLLTDVRIGDKQLIAIAVGITILALGGYLDDRNGLKPWQQFIFPLMAVIVTVVGGIGVSYITNPFVSGTGPYGRSLFYFVPVIGIIVSAIWLLGMIYTTKLLDGLDGLVAGVGCIGSIILFFVSLYWDVPLSGTSFLALIVAGTCIGFLWFNFHPATIFLGEGGSTIIGYLLGVIAIISGAKIATALLIMGIPILDVVWVIIRRIFVERRSAALGDRKHLHFRLLDNGFSYRQTVLILWGLTAFFGTVSLFLQSQQKVIALVVLVVVMTLLAGMIVLRDRRRTT